MAAGRLLEVTAYLIFLVLCFEGGARALLSAGPVRKRVLGMDDASMRLRFTRRPHENDLLDYSFDVPHPVRGWALRPALHDLPVFKGKHLNTNSRSVRGATEHQEPRSQNVRRILVFGDSFTFGEGVSDDETYCAQLQALLPEADVVNLGVHGYGHDQMLLYLKEVGASYAPDLVLLGFVADDMARNRLSFRDFAKPRFEVREGRLVLTGVPVPTPEAVLAEERWRSKLGDLFTMLSARLRERTGREGEEKGRLTSALLDEFERTVAGLGARSLLAYLPGGEEIAHLEKASEGERFFSAYGHERGRARVVLRDAFRAAESEGTPLKTEGHWDPLEHGIAARGLRDALVEERFWP